jgi:hypothetical protein
VPVRELTGVNTPTASWLAAPRRGYRRFEAVRLPRRSLLGAGAPAVRAACHRVTRRQCSPGAGQTGPPWSRQPGTDAVPRPLAGVFLADLVHKTCARHQQRAPDAFVGLSLRPRGLSCVNARLTLEDHFSEAHPLAFPMSTGKAILSTSMRPAAGLAATGWTYALRGSARVTHLVPALPSSVTSRYHGPTPRVVPPSLRLFLHVPPERTEAARPFRPRTLE